MSDTPITDQHSNGSIVAASKMRELERAANEMREALRSSDNHEFGCHIRAKAALARFDSLKKKL